MKQTHDVVSERGTALVLARFGNQCIGKALNCESTQYLIQAPILITGGSSATGRESVERMRAGSEERRASRESQVRKQLV